MKKLTLIRHAEAANPSAKQTDFERTLTAYGLHQAEQMAGLLAEQGFSYDQMFASTAQRALSTALTIHAALAPTSSSLVESPPLYNISASQLYRFIELLDDNIHHAVIVAHNPGLSLLLNDLLAAPVQGMPPCSVAQLTLNINDWVEIHAGCGQLSNYKVAR